MEKISRAKFKGMKPKTLKLKWVSEEIKTTAEFKTSWCWELEEQGTGWRCLRRLVSLRIAAESIVLSSEFDLTWVLSERARLLKNRTSQDPLSLVFGLRLAPRMDSGDQTVNRAPGNCTQLPTNGTLFTRIVSNSIVFIHQVYFKNSSKICFVYVIDISNFN